MGERITVFAREVAEPDGRDRPFLVFPGRPGLRGAAADAPPVAPGLADRALKEFRVLMLDQRGTGRSTPVGRRPGLAPRSRPAPDALPRRLDRARRRVDAARRSASSAGACSARASAASASMTYLSLAPDGLREAFITGGLPPLGRPVDDVYARDLRAHARPRPPLLRALPGGPRAGPRDVRGSSRGRPAAVGRPPQAPAGSASSAGARG